MAERHGERHAERRAERRLARLAERRDDRHPIRPPRPRPRARSRPAPVRQDTSTKILILNLGAFGETGGIERYCLDLHQAVVKEYPRTVTLSLWDQEQDVNKKDLRGGFYLPCGRKKRVFFLRFLGLLLRYRPDVVWLGHVLLLPLLPVIKLLRPRARLVVLGYGYEVWNPLSSLYRRWLRRADRVVAITRFTARRIERAQRVDAKRIAVIPPALPLAITPGERPVIRAVPPSKPARILTVSRLGFDAELKGLPAAIGSFRRVLRQMPDARYTIVGDGPARPRLEEMAARLGLSDRVEFAGHVSDRELGRRYRESDVFLLPSSVEGFGIVYAEAMIHGLPVVAGDRDAAQELVQNGRTGLVVDPTSEKMIADAVVKILRRPDRGQALGWTGRRRVIENFTFDHYERRVRALLAMLLEKPPLPRSEPVAPPPPPPPPTRSAPGAPIPPPTFRRRPERRMIRPAPRRSLDED